MQAKQTSRLSNKLRDATYMAMLRFEARKPQADTSLRDALLQAWRSAGELKEVADFQSWLQKITPICLEMLFNISVPQPTPGTAPDLGDGKELRRSGKHMRRIMEITVKHLDQVRFSVQAREHTIICDQPADNGGNDTGMTPPEFLLASLGTCAGFYAVQYLKTRNLSTEGVEVKVTAEKLKPPARLGNFVIQVNAPLELTEEQKQGLTRSVHQCLIHNTLLNPPSIAIELTTSQRQLVS